MYNNSSLVISLISTIMPEKNIPTHIARLVILFLQNKLTGVESGQLDQWITSSNNNAADFDYLIQNNDEFVFDPLQFIAETEDVLNWWMISGLAVRQQQGVLNAEQNDILNDWIAEKDDNKAKFEKLSHQENLLAMITFLKKNESIPRG